MVLKYILLCAWLGLVFLGLSRLNDFSQTPGKSSEVPFKFPSHSTLASRSKKPLLLVFIHPKCVCSRATVSELEKLIPHLSNIEVKVIFNQFSGRDIAWTKNDLWVRAEKIKGIEMILDERSRETQMFKVETSGHTFLFDEKGELVFSGGITPARGHEGESNGQMMIKKWIKTRANMSTFEKVFGCELFGIKS